jgi:hypothetical protein
MRTRFTEVERELVSAQQTVGRELADAHAVIGRLQDEIARQEGLATMSDFGDEQEDRDDIVTFRWHDTPVRTAKTTASTLVGRHPLDASMSSMSSIETPDLVHSPEASYSYQSPSIYHEIVTAKPTRQADGWWA